MQKLKIDLPDKPSELIRIGVRDLRACAADANYVVDLDVWHRPDRQGRCLVGLAGAVMAQSGKASIKRSLFPIDYALPVQRKLWAIHYLQRQRFDDAFEALERSHALSRPNGTTQIPPSLDHFCATMTAMANWLDGEGH